MATDGGCKFTRDGDAADGELSFSVRKEWHVSAGSRIIAEFSGGEDIGIAVELSREGEVFIVGVIVLMAFHVADGGKLGEGSEEEVNGGKHIVF